MDIKQNLYKKRRTTNLVGLTLSMTAMALGLTVLLFVVLGNPSAGGAYQTELLPAFWRVLGTWIPNGAGTTAVRRLVYFPDQSVTFQVLLIAAYAVVGAAITLVAATYLARFRRRVLVADGGHGLPEAWPAP